MKKILTIIFDGFGIREEEKGNAIKAAGMRVYNNLWEEYPHSVLAASEEAVGLNAGQVGNSEVGHSTIGAGRVIKQNEIIVNEFFQNVDLEDETMIKLLECKDDDVHIVGLCSDGNVHAGVDDFLNMYELLVSLEFKKIHFHLMTDGRDTEVDKAYSYIKQVEDVIAKHGVGDIATVCGRYYGMDRDNNWHRTQVYYNLIVNGKGTNTLNIEKALASSYSNGVMDEFIKPIVLNEHSIKNGDAVIWMNYRTDRSKQILRALVDKNFEEFSTNDLSDIKLFTFFEMDKKVKSNKFIETSSITNPLGIYLSQLGFTQARIAESEKYPHVTYFFDGSYDGKIENCDKFHIPSPHVETYDLQPEMSAVEVTKKVISCMQHDYDFILVNYANTDMVGHTGNMEATTRACIAIDFCLEKLLEKAEENFYKVVLLADHGNADKMINEDGSVCTTHTLAEVPFIIVDKKVKLKKKGSLANVAPTLLEYMDIAIPKEMEETESLLISEE